METLSNRPNGFSVLIPDGGKYFINPIISCLAQIPGVTIDILAEKPWAHSRFSSHVRAFYLDKTKPYTKEWIETIRHISEKNAIDIILPADQPAIRSISEQRELLGNAVHIMPLPSPASFDIASNKWRLAKHMQQHNLPIPKTILYKNIEQLERELPSLPFPALTKPTEGKGGDGIRYWNDPQKLKEYLKRINPQEELIIQSFIHGHFTGSSVLCKNGKILAITTQKGLLSPRLRFGFPEDIIIFNEDQAFTIIEILMASLNWSGVANIDLYYDEQDNTYKILEINPRFWGTLLGSMNAGINFPYLACLTGLGYEFPLPTYKTTPYLGGTGIIKWITHQRLPNTEHPLHMSDTAIKHFIADPIPQLLRWIEKFIKYIFNIKD